MGRRLQGTALAPLAPALLAARVRALGSLQHELMVACRALAAELGGAHQASGCEWEAAGAWRVNGGRQEVCGFRAPGISGAAVPSGAPSPLAALFGLARGAAGQGLGSVEALQGQELAAALARMREGDAALGVSVGGA
ncbi:hypothetical protein WJX81_002725 [Elliptochloris bilobata]|uniref:Uncharacterized protein n=1 Tax=Elliptochloris bilobata TaxID=381761 RepID=A0AAW1SEH2_9CHLO